MLQRPKCVIVTGQAGSGKTTLSKKLGARLWMPVVSRDGLKEGYVNTSGKSHDELPAETDKTVTDTFFEIVAHYLDAEISLVIEAAFQHRVWESCFENIRNKSYPFVVLCSIDPVLAAKRHLQRGLDDPNRERFHSDHRVVHYRNTGEFLYPAPYEPPDLGVPIIKVATHGEYSPTIDTIVKQIVSHHSFGGFVEA